MKTPLFLSLLPLFLMSCGGPSGDKEKAHLKNNRVVDIELEVEEKGELDPIANQGAIKGGSISTWQGSFPKSLNMFLDYNRFSIQVCELLFEPMAELHSEENRFIGVLADKWDVSEDQMQFTFHIHPKAKWSDGKDITAEDVVFYYDTIMNPKNLTSLFRVHYKYIERPEALDQKTVRVKAKTKHWSNFQTATTLVALPKHDMEGKNFNKINFDIPVVSGPYQIDKVQKGRSIALKRRGDWWGRVKKYSLGKYNFDHILFKSMDDQTKTLEYLKKGDLDLYPIYSSKIWAIQTDFPAVQKGWVVRQNIFNHEPKSFQGMAINLRKDKFKDRRVRLALAHLLNRKLMNDKFMYNEYYLLNSYFPDLYPELLNPKTPLIQFDSDKARELFSQAGWKVNQMGKLEKDGQVFKINFMHHSPDLRHINRYKEDLESVGIEVSIETLSYSTIQKRIDNHDFDLHWRNWGAVRLRDPEALWSSKEAHEVSTNNIAGLENAEVDALIEKQKTEMDINKRNEILREIDAILVKEIPYVLMWGAPSARLLYWNKFGTPKYVLDKFNQEEEVTTYWFVDPAKEKKLQQAIAAGQTLPKEPGKVIYP
ncbi:MAG: ABC transporter substrate-binding protein [Planctomycetes bacterium]|nr:ABC transporter substrate-binding protein [Planctomycetota bacterium]